MLILGVNAVFHDPAAALVADGEIAVAAEEERFTRRKHGKRPVAFSTWELPEQAIRYCLDCVGATPADVDVVAYSYSPDLAGGADMMGGSEWEWLRTHYVERAPRFLRSLMPDFGEDRFVWVGHHLAHAASAYLAAPESGGGNCSVMILDGRGESASALLGSAVDGDFTPLAMQHLPHSLGLLYEELTAHLGFNRSSDEYKVMALASYGEPRFLPELRRLVRTDSEGGYHVDSVDWERFAPAVPPGDEDDRWKPDHADLAASVQARLEEVELELATWLHDRTGDDVVVLAGGVALNCVANSRLWREGPFEQVWVQPASGDAGTALGAALFAAHAAGEDVRPMRTAALGREETEADVEALLNRARVPYSRPADISTEVARALADDGIVGWVQGRAEFGPRALGQRSLLANPTRPENLERLNHVKGREQFRPIAPMVPVERAGDIFDCGPIPSPYMLFTHAVRPRWRARIPAVVHVDGTARIQTVGSGELPLVHRILTEVDRLTGVPVIVNTSLNTAGRPIVDTARDALECFASGPVDLLALGPFAVRRADFFGSERQ